MSEIVDIIRSHARPLVPQPTGVAPVLQRLDGIRAVLFDVYGTLVASGCGDVGTAAESLSVAAVRAGLAAAGIGLDSVASAPDRIAQLHEATIGRHHAQARERGVEFPEVDIVEVWREVLGELATDPAASFRAEQVDAERLAVEYEAVVNPVWPMPGMVDLLGELHGLGLLLGLVSNAQFFTPLLFPALLGSTLAELGFEDDLLLFSYQFGHAKPGEYLYTRAATRLSRRGIPTEAALYIGNDMLKDVLPASRVGFRTALFAGDARSLRLREGDERIDGVRPDLVLTELRQAADCVGRTIGA